MEALGSSEESVLKRAIRRNIAEDDTLHVTYTSPRRVREVPPSNERLLV
jgi:hypothetical protein